MSRQTALAPRRRTAHASLSSLDVQILQFLTRFGIARPHHIVGWTGASPHTIKRRLPALRAAGAAQSSIVGVALRDRGGQIRDTFCTAWSATGSGIAYLEPWRVPGYADQRITLPRARTSRQMAHHALGVVDLAVWYRQQGFDVASEREIRSLEQPSGLHPERTVVSSWTVQIPGRTGVHPPDLGAVAPDGGMWAVELERATKEVRDYQAVIAAYRGAGLGQAWHIASQATARRVMDACTRLGVTWGPPPAPGVTASTDGLVRLQGWLPGRAGLSGPAQWQRHFPRSSPAGIPVPDGKPDLSASWRRGRVIDLNDGGEILGGIMW
jgi:hypothetical protein